MRIELQRGGPFPEILVGASTAPDPAPSPTASPVGERCLVELDLGSPNWRAALDRAAGSGLPLDVRAILAGDGAGSTRSTNSPRRSRDLPSLRVAAFDPMLHVTDAAAAASLRARRSPLPACTVPVIGGARSHFTELNREQRAHPDATSTASSFAMTPLFHSLGTEQLVESVGDAAADRASRAVDGGRRARARRTDHAAAALQQRRDRPEPAPTRATCARATAPSSPAPPTRASPRRSSPHGRLRAPPPSAIPGVASIAWFEEWGPRGIRSADGIETPAADALRALAALSGCELLAGDSTDGRLWAIGAVVDDEAVVLVANLDRRARELTLVVDGASTSIPLEPLAFIRLALP